MPRTIARFGWVRDLPDQRDLAYSAPLAMLRHLPAHIDLRPQCPPVYDQGRIGSCTANAIGAAIQFDRMKLGKTPDFVPSRLFIYYNERAMEGHIAFDAGAQIRDGIKSVNKLGVCTEPDWPYIDTPAEYDGGPFPADSPEAQRPPDDCYEKALRFRVMLYQRLNQSLSQLKSCFASGYPFVFGFTVYDSFFEEQGVQKVTIPLPSDNDSVLGGHAVMAVGYGDAQRVFIVRNSWGVDQGDHGYFYMPYSYVTEPNLASDFWTIRTVAN